MLKLMEQAVYSGDSTIGFVLIFVGVSGLAFVGLYSIYKKKAERARIRKFLDID